MAVVTHGSFDEGPIILALPPTYEFNGLLEEIDPVFTAWDKHTGISITQSQISDGSTLLNLTDLNNISFDSSGVITSYNLQGSTSGLNTGDQDLSGLVPYNGATSDVDLTGKTITVGTITINNTPTNPTDGINKAYFDANATTGITWDSSVLDIVDTLPLLPDEADRYILSVDNSIYTYVTDSWVETSPVSGMTVFVQGDDESPDNNIGQYTYNGSSWIYIGSSINHNDTLNIQGGSSGNYWHLSAAAIAVIPDIIESGSDAVPTGLSLVTSGISPGLDGLSYVTLTWDAIVTSTFDHYQVEYKKSAYTYYTPLSATSNTITIEGLTPNTSYNFRVASVNKFGTVSAFCTDLILITPADEVAPAGVEGLSATGAIQAILLRWDHNTDIDIASYNIWRSAPNSNTSFGLQSNFTGNVYMDNGLLANATYYYRLQAVDTSGNASDFGDAVEVSATTRNVEASDIENIAASQVIIQGLTTIASLFSPDVTTIDGANITTGTVNLETLNFVSGQAGGGIIAHINSSPETGLQINADHFSVSGASVFTAKVGGSFTSANSVPRIRIFPTTDIGIEVVDQLGANVFLAEVGGANVGDVTIGNWAGNQGIKYDRSANSTSFAGTILASAGSIGGWSILSSCLVKDTGTNSSSAGMSPTDYPFYAGSTYANRATAPFKVTNGGVVSITSLFLTGLTNYTIPRSYNDGSIRDSNITDNGKVSINTTTGLVIPRINGSPGTPEAGMIYYDTSQGHAYLYTNAWRQLD
jgi:chitodextrinase